jgi:diaminopimelate epimerase
MGRLIDFTKGHGTGNDFVLVLDPEGQLQLSPKEIARICDRHFGVGADGLIRVVKTENSPEVAHLLKDAPEAVWFMDYYNADGSTAEMCGNGSRVFARYLTEKGLVAPRRFADALDRHARWRERPATQHGRFCG